MADDGSSSSSTQNSFSDFVHDSASDGDSTPSSSFDHQSALTDGDEASCSSSVTVGQESDDSDSSDRKLEEELEAGHAGGAQTTATAHAHTADANVVAAQARKHRGSCLFWRRPTTWISVFIIAVVVAIIVVVALSDTNSTY